MPCRFVSLSDIRHAIIYARLCQHMLSPYALRFQEIIIADADSHYYIFAPEIAPLFATTCYYAADDAIIAMFFFFRYFFMIPYIAAMLILSYFAKRRRRPPLMLRHFHYYDFLSFRHMPLMPLSDMLSLRAAAQRLCHAL